MKRIFAPWMLALALPLAAQQAATPPAAQPEADKPVAVLNGEVVTTSQLERIWDNLGTQMRTQYESSGGKGAFLENYLRKRLILQEAIKSGFDKRADVQSDMNTARESALFDRYVRDVVAAPIVTEAAVRKYFDEHKEEFAQPERLKVRHIVVTASGVGPNSKSLPQALEKIKAIAAQLHGENANVRGTDQSTAARLRLIHFGDAARKYSEDASASSGGDLGWVTKGQLDPTFEAAAWKLPLGVISGIVESSFGYHLIVVETREPAGTRAYAKARPEVREFLLTQKAADVMTAVSKLTNELRGNSKVSVYPENIK
ncbi:MAG: peptidylprolyl isomerase [Thermoanaerobaculia bacterium]